jgi:hypothetical protein
MTLFGPEKAKEDVLGETQDGEGGWAEPIAPRNVSKKTFWACLIDAVLALIALASWLEESRVFPKV